jgi:DNA-binding ferritin-like protein
MPLRKTDKGWFWGSKGPFASKDKALSVARAAHAHGFKEQQMEMKPVAEFIGMLLHSATITHLMHLQAEGEGSYAAHKALGSYYEGIVEAVDAVAESIQGAYDVIIDSYPPAYADTNATPLDYMKTLRAYVRNKRTELPADSEIQNEVDNIANLINSTCYKLARLR